MEHFFGFVAVAMAGRLVVPAAGEPCLEDFFLSLSEPMLVSDEFFNGT
jgi:hypothetical protein